MKALVDEKDRLLDEKNTASSYGARESLTMDFSREDRAPDACVHPRISHIGQQTMP